jgi:AmiR/NasT family two-component response regulator
MERLQPPYDVLIVEDEALLAMDLEAMLEDAGHRVVGEAPCTRTLAELAGRIAPELVFVDMQLAHGTSGLDACAIVRRCWPAAFVVFVTANPSRIPDDFLGAHGVIPKPFSRHGLASAMRYLQEAISDPPPTSPRPGSFIPAPAFAANWAVN